MRSISCRFTPKPSKAEPIDSIHRTTGDVGYFCRSILLLEDNGPLAELLTVVLESQSLQVTHVTNGADGVRQVIANEFDAIICDMVMPNLTGDMFYKAVERTKPHLCRRFVFMTGYRSDPRWEDFIRKIDGIMLWKPFPLSNLLTALRTVIPRRPTDVGPAEHQLQGLGDRPAGNGASSTTKRRAVGSDSSGSVLA